MYYLNPVANISFDCEIMKYNMASNIERKDSVAIVIIHTAGLTK